MKKTIQTIIVLLFVVNTIDLFATTTQETVAFNKSIKYEEGRDYGNAIRVMKEQYDATSYEFNVRLGWLHYLAERVDESMRYYEIAIKLNPQSVEALDGYTYPLADKASEQEGSEAFDILMQKYNAILAINPKNINAHYQWGYHHYNQDRKEEAKKNFNNIVSLYPSGYEYYLRGTLAKMKLIETKNEAVKKAFANSFEAETEENYTLAISALDDIYDANYYNVNLRLGWLYYLNGQHNEAKGYYNNAILLKPNGIEARIGFAYPAAVLADTAQLVIQYKKIIGLDPLNTDINYKLGMIHYAQKDYASAHKCFEQVVTLYPFTYYGLLMYGWTNLHLSKKAEAKVIFDKVLLLSASDKSALAGLVLLR